MACIIENTRKSTTVWTYIFPLTVKQPSKHLTTSRSALNE
jgi:hypothetical protein